MVDVVGVDLGATRVRVALGSNMGILASLSELTNRLNGPEEIIKQITRMTRTLLSRQANTAFPEAIGVASIGPLDLRRGCVVESPNMPIKRIPLTDPLSEQFGVPVFLVNDCNAAVLGEHVYGEGKGFENLVYVTISTGIGGGAIVDGHLLIGKDGNAVEIGHMTVDPAGVMKCGCGCLGHWEAYCSGESIPKYAQWLLSTRQPEGVTSSLLLRPVRGDREKIDTRKVLEAADRGDQIALWIVEKMGALNSIGFANLVNVFDPELITVGGSVVLNHSKLILTAILQNIRNHTINRVPDIKVTALGDDVVLFGAIAFALDKLNGDKKS